MERTKRARKSEHFWLLFCFISERQTYSNKRSDYSNVNSIFYYYYHRNEFRNSVDLRFGTLKCGLATTPFIFELKFMLIFSGIKNRLSIRMEKQNNRQTGECNCFSGATATANGLSTFSLTNRIFALNQRFSRFSNRISVTIFQTFRYQLDWITHIAFVINETKSTKKT